MNWIALLGRLLLSVVFLVAAIGKLADRDGSRKALADFGVADTLIAPAALLLPLVELAIAALLVPAATARWGALAALGMLGLFIAAVTISLARGRTPDCHCFGQLHSAPVGWSTVVRNCSLAAVAAVVLWHGGENPRITSIAAGVGGAAPLALLLAGIALALAAIEAWFLLNLVPQYGRLLIRLQTLEAALGRAQPSGLAVSERAPEFELRDLAGDSVSLASLRASRRPVLLFFTNPDCAPCDAVLPAVARWQRDYEDRVDVAVISRGAVEANRAKAEKHGLRTVLLQKKREVVRAYQIDSTPSAVLVSAEGKIASPIAYGAEGIERLLEQAAHGVVYVPASVPASSDGRGNVTQPSAPAVGQPAPALVLPDLDGKPIDLADSRGASTLVLFWSPTCGFCQRMLPELKAWERKRPAHSPRLVVVSTGTVEANRAMGFASPVVLDADGAAMRAFGADGTPMAVLVDANGKVASPLARGAQEVMALAATRDRRQRPSARPAEATSSPM
jgi:methylamine dehydrogenase accessory protein MauD